MRTVLLDAAQEPLVVHTERIEVGVVGTAMAGRGKAAARLLGQRALTIARWGKQGCSDKLVGRSARAPARIALFVDLDCVTNDGRHRTLHMRWLAYQSSTAVAALASQPLPSGREPPPAEPGSIIN